MAISILCELDKQGGFTAVDLVSGVSAYAYPTSANAISARRQPATTAKAMILHEIKARAWFDPSLIPNAVKLDCERAERLRARNGLPSAKRVELCFPGDPPLALS